MMSWGMGYWMLMGVFILVVAVLALVWGVAWLADEFGGPHRRSSDVAAPATQALLGRYAAGEIDDEELTRRLARIQR